MTLDRGELLKTGLVAAALGSALLVARHGPALAVVNESPSLPKGLYLRQAGGEPERGRVVALDQPADAAPYLRGLGMPPEVRLLKRVAAVGGERVCRRGDRIETPGGIVKVLEHDRRGEALPQWTGCGPLASDQVFLLGDTTNSFDSRYFGPVRASAVSGVYREVLTW